MQEIARDGHPLVKRIGKRLARFHSILQRRETVFAKDGQARAGPAHRDALLDRQIEGFFHGCALPEINVVILATAGDEHGGRRPDLLGDERLVSSLA